jgi:hypothetical protein
MIHRSFLRPSGRETDQCGFLLVGLDGMEPFCRKRNAYALTLLVFGLSLFAREQQHAARRGAERGAQPGRAGTDNDDVCCAAVHRQFARFDATAPACA